MSEQPKLDPAFKTAWVDALRSGEYPQAHGALRKALAWEKMGFCCLGVACDVAMKLNADIGTWRQDMFDASKPGDDTRTKDENIRGGFVPRRVLDMMFGRTVTDSEYRDQDIALFGVTTMLEPAGHTSHMRVALHRLNDSNHPFNVIAHLIEEQL